MSPVTRAFLSGGRCCPVHFNHRLLHRLLTVAFAGGLHEPAQRPPSLTQAAPF